MSFSFRMAPAVQGDLLPGPRLTPTGMDALRLHEAGHAVILEITGGRVELVLSNVDPTRLHAHGVKGGGWTSPAILAGIAAERVAGLAEFHPTEIRREEERLLGWGDDLRHFRKWSSGHPGEMRQVLDEAEDLVREHWDAVRAVADALREQETLSGDEVRGIVGAARSTDAQTTDHVGTANEEVDREFA